jgi:hypothetical protein
VFGKGDLLAVVGWKVQTCSCTDCSLNLGEELVRRDGRIPEEYGDWASPPPEPFGGASLVTGPDDQGAPLDVFASNHFTNEYAPGTSGCHRTFRLLATG